MGTINSEFETRVITGAIDLNAEWDAYVKKWLSNGGKQYIEALDKAPLVSGLRQGKRIYE